MALLPLKHIFFTNKYQLILENSHPYTPKLTIISQNDPNNTSQPTNSKPIPSSGQGFGPAQIPKPDPSSTPSSSSSSKKGRKGIVRRNPVEKPAFLSKKSVAEESKSNEFGVNESAFLVTWLGLGGVILVEGLALSASGFLPEEWDKLFVKYLYPSFTPTIFLFFAGTITYGVYKYFQNENANNQN